MRSSFILAAALALALSPAGLAAKPGGGNGNSHGNGHDNGQGNGDDNDQDNGHDISRGNPHDLDANGTHNCPPGLAWREPACVPPGLARQGVDTEDWIGPMTTNYLVGDYLDPEDFVVITDLDKLGLPQLLQGEEYVVIDGTLVRLDSETYEILQLIRAIDMALQ